MTFHSQQRPLEAYFMAMDDAGDRSKRSASRAFRNVRSFRNLSVVGSECLSSRACGAFVRRRHGACAERQIHPAVALWT
jgi:hypothetical protein